MREDAPKLCLLCARRSLAGQPPKPCGACPLLNIDHLAQVRANAARPSPLRRYSLAITGNGRAAYGAIASNGHNTPRQTSWERGE